MKKDIIDIIAFIFGAILIAVVCGSIGLILYFRVVERPKEIRPEKPTSDISWHEDRQVEGLVAPRQVPKHPVRVVKGCGYSDLHHDCRHDAVLARLGWDDSPEDDDREGVLMRDPQGMPVIDIQPGNDSGLEGTVEGAELEKLLTNEN